jgi:GTP-binding protein
MTKPVVAIVGRPNVGKSTLVNRIIGKREAIVEERPGVTRDRVLYQADWRGRAFTLVDTGGLELDPESLLAGKVADAAKAAASEADVVAFVVDVTDGITPEDSAVADVVRRIGRPVVLIANKSDTAKHEQNASEFFSLGLGEPIPISALQGRGIGDLLDVLTDGFPAEEEEEERDPAIAIVGRPNVGKSTLFNRIVGTERSIVHDEPGTTRDAVDTIVVVDDRTYRFVDTAGLRRGARVDEDTEFFSSLRTMRAIERSDVAVLLIDATQGVSRQDLRIADEISELGRSAIVVLNKTDALPTEELMERRAEVKRRFPHLRWAPFLDLSARTGRNVQKLLAELDPILEARQIRVPTPLLNVIVDDLQARTPIPSSGRGQRVKYAVQAEVAPPTIVLFGANNIPEQWLRYLERGLRERFGFEGTPIRFITKGKERRRRAG